MEHCFQGPSYTVGVEEELMIVDGGSYELANAIVRLSELDAAAKGGSRLPADLELERTLIDVTRPRAA